jgi:muconate cycloisomerase
VVKVATESGIAGYGEGVPRPYVTGETGDSSFEYIKTKLLPHIIGFGDPDNIAPDNIFSAVDSLLGEIPNGSGVVWNASHAAVELAMIDLLFRINSLSVGSVLKPVSENVVYSGVITSGSDADVMKAAHRCKNAGLKTIKIKVSGINDVSRIASVRELMGATVSIRLDANAAFNIQTAEQFAKAVEQFKIDCIEQPIPPGSNSELAVLRSRISIPIMADESLVTIEDAEKLAAANAVDYFNLRISKCGGIYNTLAIADIARRAGIGIQLGCQVGETAILSAAGRHLAAHLPQFDFVEGSFGTHLLKEDISESEIGFGFRGNAPLLNEIGLGVTVDDRRLEKYTEKVCKWIRH